MERVKFAVAGSGWRSEFYIRIALKFPDKFELVSLLVRNDNKVKKFRDKYGIKAVKSRDQLVESTPDFVVVAVNKDSLYSVTKEFLELDIPVLCETPAGVSLEDLNNLWRLKQSGKKIQIAEQYFLFPYFSQILNILKDGRIGDPDFIDLSAIHDYHGFSIIKRALGITDQKFRIFGTSQKTTTVITGSRDGKVTDGSIGDKLRKVATIQFENGKSAIYNFTNVQYFSDILKNSVVIQGERGEVRNNEVTYVDDSNIVRSFFIDGKLKDYDKTDEIVLETILLRMAKFVKSGEEFYPLSDALQDAYMTIVMNEAIESGLEVQSEEMIWFS